MSEHKEPRLYVWTTNRARDPGACQYYRINVPLRLMEKMGYSYGYEDRGAYGQEDLKAMLTSDICQLYSISGEDPLHQVKTINQMNPGKRGDGVIQYPPVCVYDTDDNADFVHPMNFTYAMLGVRSYPDGKLLKPGEQIEFEWEDGRREIIWEDLETEAEGGLFDISRNLHTMKIRHEIIQSCAGATVSSAALASYFKNVIGQKNVYIFPNTINLDDYEFYETARTDSNIRIFWQGSPSHYVDWYPLKDAIKYVAHKYKNVTWVIWGQKFDWIHGVIPEDQIEHKEWIPYSAYKLRRGLINIDINLCPLANNAFNRCKSAIKWYEASVWPKPEATLAAHVEPYKEIIDGETGLLYNNPEEFANKLEILINNPDLRAKLGHNSKQWILANRQPQHTIPGLAEFYHELKYQQKVRHNPKIIVPV